MRLIITDTGFIWNHDNPFLERFKEIVLVVCLGGKAVTNKYECFISPYKGKNTGIEKYGIEDRRFQALASVNRKLCAQMGYHDDIVFLADNEPSTLYPYCIFKELNEYNKLHLVTMSPWKFDSNTRIKGYYDMLSDLSRLDSILYYDSDKALSEMKGDMSLPNASVHITNELGEMMPRFLNGIYNMCSGPCFFEFASMEYIPLKEGFDEVNISRRDTIVDDLEFPIERRFFMLGLVEENFYPEDSKDVKEVIERPAARLDGKRVCNVLREQRIRLAAANNIPFKSEICPSIGPCAGTCRKCDAESEYLREQMKKIPEEKRIYPQFDPSEEVRV